MTDAGDSFIELTFDGGRFKSHSVPVSVLSELGTMQEILLRVARFVWLRGHKERVRVPRGFNEAARLNLVASRENCYTAVLRQSESPRARTVESFDAVFDEALDLTVKALAAAANDNGDGAPGNFPADALELLGNLGRQLGEDEELRIRGRTSDTVARVDQRSRARLAQWSRKPLEVEVEFEGEAEQFDDFAHRVWVRDRHGSRIEVPYGLHRRDELIEAVRQRPMVRVRVRGEMILGPQSRMKTVEELETVDDERAADLKKLWDRLKELESVPEGWLEGKGRKPTDRVLAYTRGVLARLLVELRTLPRPKVFPTPDGGLQAEWVLTPWAAEARFDPSSEVIVLEATNTDTGEDREHVLVAGKVSAENAALLGEWLAPLASVEDARV
ncbi:MAG: hypothetical protein QM820_06530 [Minicystis sp.]